MPEVILLSGSNMGDSEATLHCAREMISHRIGTVTAASSLHRSEPWGCFDPAEPTPLPFVNQAIAVDTNLDPESVLRAIHLIEKELGRAEEKKISTFRSDDLAAPERLYRSRTVDIDILFYEDQIIDTENLTIPHPRLGEREFVLRPLCEIRPMLIHPILKISVNELFNSFLVSKFK